MPILFRFLYPLLGFFISVSALAEKVILPRPANVRQSKNFYGQENILDQLPQNSEVDIISRKFLPSGAEALEIKIISPSDKTYLNDKKIPLYIWHSKIEIQNKTFTEAGVPCTSCKTNISGTPSTTQDIQKITHKIEEQQSEDKLPQKENVTEGDKSENCPSEEKIQAYSNSPQVAKSIRWAKTHIINDGLCYRHTKEILATQTYNKRGPGNNIIPKWYETTPPPAWAYKGAQELLKYGFKNLLNCQTYRDQIISGSNVNMDKIPHGAVLIYSREGEPGHAEFKFTDPDDGKTKYAYGPILPYPVNRGSLGSLYKLIGVMVKP